MDDSFVMSWEGMGKCVLCYVALLQSYLACSVPEWHMLDGKLWFSKWWVHPFLDVAHILLLKYNFKCFSHHQSTTFLSFHASLYILKKTSCYLKNVFKYFCLLNTWGFAVYFFTGNELVQWGFNNFYTILKTQFLCLTGAELYCCYIYMYLSLKHQYS